MIISKVAFRFMYLVDDGQTVCEAALRTHPQYRGQDLQRKLKSFLIDELKKIILPGSMEKISFVYTAAESEYHINKITNDVKVKLLLKRVRLTS